VGIPADVVSTLRLTGTVKDSDFIGPGTYVMANGSEQSSQRFVLHKMAVGNHVITNVVAFVIAKGDHPLLGQSFLAKLPGGQLIMLSTPSFLRMKRAPMTGLSPLHQPPQPQRHRRRFQRTWWWRPAATP
jgi:hypothetical protein